MCGGGAYAPEPVAKGADKDNKDKEDKEEPLSVTEYVREGDKFVANKVVPSYLLNGKKLPCMPFLYFKFNMIFCIELSIYLRTYFM